jgi:hypothetical protein
MIKTTLLKEVLVKYPNKYFVETGTANGDCVRIALECGFQKVFSVELDVDLQTENIKNYQPFIKQNKVNLVIGDSLFELCNLITKLDAKTTFWLDAHQDFGPKGVKRCPLYEEIECIKNSSIKTHTIMIDDLRMLGHWWGEGVDLDTLKNKILEINTEYKFTLEDGHVPNDILVAYI